MCVSTEEAKMETASLVEKEGHEVYTSVGCKTEVKSTAVTP